jgi:hypothetical protein
VATPPAIQWGFHNTINTRGIAMDMINVRSSAIYAIGYDPETARMKIRFHNSGTYDFCHVPERVFQQLLNASSKGDYYHRHIKGHYRCH